MYRPMLTLAMTVLAVAPLSAQGNITLGVTVKVESENIPDFEEAAKKHAAWHAQQNDPWAWPAYMAMSGETEYIFLTPGHSWSDFDNPPVDMAADMGHWVREGARYSVSETAELWQDLVEFSNMPATPTALAQVFSFAIKPGGEDAVMHGIRKFKEATGDQGSFLWNRSLTGQGPPTISVVIMANSFAELGNPGPGPEQILANAFGQAEAEMISEGFTNAVTPLGSRIWVFRPDLSYLPNQ